MVITQTGRVYINRVRLPILLVVCSTGKKMFPCPRSRLIIWSREMSSVVPSRVSLLILHTQAKSSAYLRDSFLPNFAAASIYLFKHPYAIGSVPSYRVTQLIAYRWRFLPRVRRHRAGSPQGSFSSGCYLLQAIMDQFTCASSLPTPTTLILV